MQKIKWPIIALWCGIAVIVYMLSTLGVVIKPFLLALLGAYVLKWPVAKLEKKHIPRAIGAIVSIVSVYGLITLFLFLLVPSLQGRISILISQIPSLASSVLIAIKPFLNLIQEYAHIDSVEALREQIMEHSSSIMHWVFSTSLNVLSSTTVIVNIVMILILTPIIMFYLLQDWPNMVRHIKSWLPQNRKEAIISEFNKMDHAVVGYAKGQSLVCLTLAILYAIGLTVVGLQGSVIIGVMIGVLSFIPYIGAIIGFFTSIVFALTQSPELGVLPIIIVFMIMQGVEGYLLTPKLVGKKIGIPPVMVIFVLLAGGFWFGIFGVLLALPTAAIIRVLLDSLKKWMVDNGTL